MAENPGDGCNESGGQGGLGEERVISSLVFSVVAFEQVPKYGSSGWYRDQIAHTKVPRVSLTRDYSIIFLAMSGAESAVKGLPQTHMFSFFSI